MSVCLTTGAGTDRAWRARQRALRIAVAIGDHMTVRDLRDVDEALADAKGDRSDHYCFTHKPATKCCGCSRTTRVWA